MTPQQSQELELWKNGLIKMGVPEKTAKKFLDWHVKHPEIWKMFKMAALKLIAKGRKHYAAKTIIEVIRYHTDVKGGQEFKISNNYTAYYARIFALRYPRNKDFFVMKKIKGLKSTTKEQLQWN